MLLQYFKLTCIYIYIAIVYIVLPVVYGVYSFISITGNALVSNTLLSACQYAEINIFIAVKVFKVTS